MKLIAKQIKENKVKLPQALALSMVTKMVNESTPELLPQWKAIINQLVIKRDLKVVYTKEKTIL